jgi:hypothetical protein
MIEQVKNAEHEACRLAQEVHHRACASGTGDRESRRGGGSGGGR